MTINQAIQQLFDIEENRGEQVVNPETLAIGIARLGSATDQQIRAGTLIQLSTQNFGPPLHSLIIVGSKLHSLEVDYIRGFSVDERSFDELTKNIFNCEN
ncbi:16414_t:CDS:2 [Acaulospora colombiana]|uniref:16414_t:CDS:1 n=1 Tax=Acaulospora colombiana TaxID=27376 RepID=A0ACA9LSA4_9GLOM|nr:16414_t:CDS:2 [Acaulospora colombiana]